MIGACMESGDWQEGFILQVALEGKLTGEGDGVAGLLTKAIDLVKYGLWGIL